MVLKTVYFVTFIDFVCIGMIMTLVVPNILSNGGSVLLAGIAESIFSGLQFIGAPIMGSWSDTLGRKKVFIYTLSISILSNALLLVSSGSLAIFILARFLNSSVHHVQVLIKAIAVDHIPEKDQVKVFNSIGALAAVAFIFSPVIGGHLYEAHGDFFYIVVIINTLYLACIGAVALLPEAQRSTKSTEKKSGVFENFRRINWNQFWDVFLFKILIELTFSFWASASAILTREVFKIPTKSAGYFFGYIGILMVLSNIFMPYIQKNLYPNDNSGTKKIKVALLLKGSALSLMALSQSFSMFVILCIPFFMSKVLLDTVWMKILLDRIKDKDKGVILGASDSIMPLCNFISPLAIGAVGQIFSLGTARYLPLLALAVSVPIIDKLGK